MKKTTLILISFFISCSVFGQVTQKEKITSGMFLGTLSAHKTGDDIMISWFADDMQYDHITALISVFYGSPNEFSDFCDDILAFANEYGKDASTDINNVHVEIKKELGATVLWIWERNASGGLGGYRKFTPKQIEKVQDKFLKWAKKNRLDV